MWLCCFPRLCAGFRHHDSVAIEDEAIPPALDRLYTKGIRFLAKTQSEDGSWQGQYGGEPAVVGLSVLSILAHGEDPNFGPYNKTVHRGINFILGAANADTGYIGTSMYNHGFATLALAEAYGVVNDPRIGPALQKAVNLILTSQAGNPQNAWRYSPESADADTTVSGAQMVALFAARNAGIGVPEPAIQKALKFIVDCQSPDGGIGYSGAGGPDGARTAIGTLVLALGKKQKSAPFLKAFKFLKGNVSGDNDSYYHYYLYYAAQAFFRASPRAWTQWNRANIKNLSETQEEAGNWEGNFGPSFTTAASLLSLALNYRFLPIYER